MSANRRRPEVAGGPLKRRDSFGGAMRRRDFITFLACTAATWPLLAREQPRSAWRIGMLEPNPSSPSDPFVDAFRDGLRGLGYKEGRDVFLEIRWAGGSNEPLFGLAVELVALKVDVL